MGEPLLLLHGEEQRVEAVQVVPVGGRQLAQRVVQLLGPGQPLVARLRDVLPTLDRGDSLHEQSTNDDTPPWRGCRSGTHTAGRTTWPGGTWCSAGREGTGIYLVQEVITNLLITGRPLCLLSPLISNKNKHKCRCVNF